MISQNGRAWVESFKNSVDFYKNVARMLQAADDIMRPRGLFPNDDGPCIVPKQKLKDFVEWPMWLPEFVFRQYRSNALLENDEIVTVAAALHLIQNPVFPEPICIASRVRLSDAGPEEVCWVPVLQAYQRNPQADGVVYTIKKGFEDFVLAENDYQRVNTILKGFLTVAYPLLNITNPNELKDKLIDPLLSDSRWS